MSTPPASNINIPDKVPIILRDGETGEVHYIFARRPKETESAFNVSISFHTKDGKLHKQRIPVHHHSTVHDVTINGRFMIFNDTSKYKDPEEVGKLLMHKALQEQIADKGKPRKTHTFQNRASRLKSQSNDAKGDDASRGGNAKSGARKGSSSRLLSVKELANGKIKLSTRKIT